MIDGFHCLRHDTIVGCYNNNSDICYFCSTSTHSRKGFMTRCIQESNTTAVRQLHIISTNMLSDTTRFTGNHIRITDIIQQRSLTMVNVSHHRNNRWTRNPIFFVIFIFKIGEFCNVNRSVLGFHINFSYVFAKNTD